MSRSLRLRAGDLVEIRSKQEILATLDEHAALEGLPFMPEMLPFCGKRVRVAAVAHKTCETAHRTWQARRLHRTVHLEGLRCDGSAHGGCQADCNFFWKEAWLKPVDERDGRSRDAGPHPALAPAACDETRLQASTEVGETPDGKRYSCQATRLFESSEPLLWWDPRQYLRDVLSGNHSLGHVARVLWLAFLQECFRRTPFGYRIVKSLREWMHRRLTGHDVTDIDGTIPVGQPTPTGRLGLKVGELVRIKSRSEIVKTLNTRRTNRGLSFDAEMGAYCGHVARVRRAVTQIIDEESGTMRHMDNPCITLEGVYCRGEYSSCRLLCPRAIPPYWREIWLERVAER